MNTNIMKNKNRLYFTISLLILMTIILEFNSGVNAMNASAPKKHVIRKFTIEEDKRLTNAVHKYAEIRESKGIKKIYHWDEIAKEVGGGKTQRQCRKRWHEYLSTEDIRKPWSEEQDRFLLEKQGELGNKWATIAGLLGDKSAMNVKNRFHILIKRQGGASNIKRNCLTMVSQPLAPNQPIIPQQDQVVIEKLNRPAIPQQNQIAIENLIELPDNNLFNDDWIYNGNDFTDFTNYKNTDNF